VTRELTKGFSRLGDLDPSVLSVLQATSTLSVASRAWRGVAHEAFLDPRFFSISPETSREWEPVIFNLTGTDKQTFVDLVGRISATPAGGLFTSRDLEISTRVMNLRRMAYAVFVAPKNHFLTHLPAIQEKLVDVLKGSASALVQAEVARLINFLQLFHLRTDLFKYARVALSSLTTQHDEHLAGFVERTRMYAAPSRDCNTHDNEDRTFPADPLGNTARWGG
jgi:hypothetical protein